MGIRARIGFITGVVAGFAGAGYAGAGPAPFPIRAVAINGQGGATGLTYSPYRVAANDGGSYAMLTMPPAGGDRLVRDGQVLLPTSGGAALGVNTVMSVSLANTGHVSSVVYIPGTYPGTVYDRYTVFYDSTPILRPADASRSSAFPAGSYWSAIHDAAVNDRGEVFVVGDITPPSGSSGSKQVIAKLTVDAAGQVTSEQTLFADFDKVADGAGVTSAANPPRHAWEWEANNAGQVLVSLTLFPSSGGSAAALYRDGTQLFKSGQATPVAGHVYGWIRASHMNDAGDWAAVVTLDSSSTEGLLVRDGQKVVAVGDLLSNGYHLTTLDPITYIGNDGAVFWSGAWDDPNGARNIGIFRDQQLLVQQGVTSLDGATFSALNHTGLGMSFAASDDGRQLAFGGTLADGRTGLFMMAVPEPAVAPIAAVTALIAAGRTRRRRRAAAG